MGGRLDFVPPPQGRAGPGAAVRAREDRRGQRIFKVDEHSLGALCFVTEPLSSSPLSLSLSLLLFLLLLAQTSSFVPTARRTTYRASAKVNSSTETAILPPT